MKFDAYVTKAYENDYTITDIYGEVLEFDETSDKISAVVAISLKRVLLEKSADELMYIKGLEAAKDQLIDAEMKANAENYINQIKKDMNENYIGVEQEENDIFNVVVNRNALTKSAVGFQIGQQDNLEVTFETMTGECSMDEFGVASANELFSAGKDTIVELKDTMNMNNMRTIDRAQELDRVAARDYARKYTDDSGELYNTSSYNDSFESFNPNDCANYVSQCLNAGGVNTDADWKPYVTNWNTTGYNGYGLVDYMVDEGIMFETSTKLKTCAGSIIYWTNNSHVGLVDQNDTKIMTFCAHTKNRKSCSYKNESNVKFFVPVWDSYTNSWTPQ